LNKYEALGIPEYWIVDYAGLSGIQYIDIPKQPTVTIHRLIDGEYLAQKFQGDQLITSPTFLQLILTTSQIVSVTE
jgi:Uma2 family endonuclease